MQVRRVENFLQEIPLPLPKCLIVGEPEQLMKTEAELSLRLQRQISVYRSEPYFLELVPLGIDKSTFDRRIIGKAGYHPRRSGSHGRRLQ